MKRKISCLLVLALLFGLTLALPSSAYTRLSYGTDCLAAQSELIKSGLRGSDIRFTEADFKQALGVSRVSSVTLLSLPPVTDGVLKAGGVPCVTGQVLDRASIATLTFTPASAAVENASFTFCANEDALSFDSVPTKHFAKGREGFRAGEHLGRPPDLAGVVDPPLT